MFGFLSGIYKFNTSFVTTFDTSKSTTRATSTSRSTTTTFSTSKATTTTFSTSRATTTTFSTSRATTTTFSTSKSTTTTFNTTRATTTTFNTSRATTTTFNTTTTFTTSYTTREPASGYYYQNAYYSDDQTKWVYNDGYDRVRISWNITSPAIGSEIFQNQTSNPTSLSFGAYTYYRGDRV